MTALMQNRLETLEAAILRHRQDKAATPECSCWATETQKWDKALYASLDLPDGPEERLASLEAAIRANQAAKMGMPDCPCWANAPQRVDAELFGVL